MAGPVNPSSIVRAARLARSVSQQRQLIVIGNVSELRSPGTVPFRNSVNMIRHTDLRPAAAPSVALLQDLGIKSSHQLGYSYGADKAAAVTALAGDIEDPEKQLNIRSGVFVEPAGIAERGLWRLMQDFMRSGSELDAYVKQANSAVLREARSGYNAYTTALYFLGLTRLSNLAIAQCLSHKTFEDNVVRAIDANEELSVTIGSGELSEMDPDGLTQEIAGRLANTFGQERVHAMWLKRMHHAGADDLNLHAAIMLHGLKLAA